MINIGIIGTGPIAREHDVPGVLKYDSARIIVVSDLDSKRCQEGKQFVEEQYAKKGITQEDVRTCADYPELRQNKDIDAAVLCTPDHAL